MMSQIKNTSPIKLITTSLFKKAQTKTNLHEAVQGGDISRVKLLLRKNPDVNKRNGAGETALHIAVKLNKCKKYSNIVKILVKHKSELSVTNQSNKTVIDNLVDCDDVQCFRHIIRNIPSDEKSQIVSIMKHLVKINRMDFLEIVLKKIKHSGTFTDKKGRTVLHTAVCLNQLNIIHKLASFINLNSQDKNGDTALHLAVKNNNNKIVGFLLSLDADVSIKNNDGNNALHCSVIHKNYFGCLVLTDRVNLCTKNNEGETVFHIAVKKCLPKFLDIFLYETYSGTHDRILRATLDQLKDLGDVNGNTALHHACLLEDYVTVTKLLDIAKVNKTLQNANGETALMIATKKKNLCITNYLEGAEITCEEIDNYLCCICFDVPVWPKKIYQCKNEHIYCSSCDTKDEICSCKVCGVTIKTKLRNLKLENKLASVIPHENSPQNMMDPFESLFTI